MNYVNNWLRDITLEQGATSCPLALPDGEYRLTLADAAAGATRWEIVDASVVSGVATLARGLEGTTDQDWLTGSVIYCSLTAGAIASMGSLDSGSAPPDDAPSSTGRLFVDTVSLVIYASTGTDSWDDWRLIGRNTFRQLITDNGTGSPNAIGVDVRDVLIEEAVSGFDGTIAVVLPPMGGAAGSLEHLRMDVKNPGTSIWKLQINCSDIAGLLGLTSIRFDVSGVESVVASGAVVTLDLIGSQHISVAACALSAGVGLVRIESAQRPDFVTTVSQI